MINVENLIFSYSKDNLALGGISFSVKKGEVFGFLGPNGSGKSTTQKILSGILNGYKGQVSVLGKDIKTCNKEFFQNIGVLFEFPYLYTNLSAVDNLKYFSSFYPKNRRKNIYNLLEKVALKKDYYNKRVASYSKGMKQRTSMARALVGTPKLLFLDEPTGGLDPSGSVFFRELIKELKNNGTTVFLTTHNMFDADILCDKVAFISDGEIKAIDTPKNLKTQNSSKEVEIDFIYNGIKQNKIIDIKEIKSGIPFMYDEIKSIHTKEPTLEDVFIKITGKGLYNA